MAALTDPPVSHLSLLADGNLAVISLQTSQRESSSVGKVVKPGLYPGQEGGGGLFGTCILFI